jgi:hypothetical protein
MDRETSLKKAKLIIAFSRITPGDYKLNTISIPNMFSFISQRHATKTRKEFKKAYDLYCSGDTASNGKLLSKYRKKYREGKCFGCRKGFTIFSKDPQNQHIARQYYETEEQFPIWPAILTMPDKQAVYGQFDKWAEYEKNSMECWVCTQPFKSASFWDIFHFYAGTPIYTINI